MILLTDFKHESPSDSLWFLIVQQPAVNVLGEIRDFLEANPAEIVTIFIEDYVKTPRGLTEVLAAAGLTKFLLPVARMPKDGGEWPLVSDMVSRNERLLVFTSSSTKEASEGIAYTWRYVVENQCKRPALFWLRLPLKGGIFHLTRGIACRRQRRVGARVVPESRRVTADELDRAVPRPD